MIEALQLPSTLGAIPSSFSGDSAAARKAAVQLWVSCKARRQELNC
jgi:hypothetical protein